MMAELAPLVSLVQAWAWVGFCVFLRIGAMVALIPVLGDQMIPARVRLAIGLALSAIVAPAVADDIPPISGTLIRDIAVLGPEVLAGLFFGMLLRFFVFALQIASSIAAQSTSLSQIFGGSAGVEPQPAIGHILVTAGLALAVTLGLHVQMAAFATYTYQLVPPGVLITAADMRDLGLAEIGRCFALGFSLAGPFLIASLIYNVTLGVINRAMPQLMVTFIGAPAITAGGMLLMLLAAPVMLSIWVDAFSGFLASPLGLAR